MWLQSHHFVSNSNRTKSDLGSCSCHICLLFVYLGQTLRKLYVSYIIWTFIIVSPLWQSQKQGYQCALQSYFSVQSRAPQCQWSVPLSAEEWQSKQSSNVMKQRRSCFYCTFYKNCCKILCELKGGASISGLKKLFGTILSKKYFSWLGWFQIFFWVHLYWSHPVIPKTQGFMAKSAK